MPRHLPTVLTKDEAAALLAQTNTSCPTGLRNRALLELLYRAGLRNGEARHLCPGHIRWAEGIVEVRRGKGDKDRMVPVDQEVLGWLRAWQAKRPPGRYFFCTLKGGPLSARYLQQLVRRLASRAGIERAVTPHTLRHSYATSLLNDGFNIREVQELLGHADLSTTQIYTHVSPADLAAKIQRRRGDGQKRERTEALVARLLELPEDALAALVEALAGRE